MPSFGALRDLARPGLKAFKTGVGAGRDLSGATKLAGAGSKATNFAAGAGQLAGRATATPTRALATGTGLGLTGGAMMFHDDNQVDKSINPGRGGGYIPITQMSSEQRRLLRIHSSHSRNPEIAAVQQGARQSMQRHLMRVDDHYRGERAKERFMQGLPASPPKPRAFHPVVKAGDWKTIEQRERSQVGNRRNQRRGVNAISLGVGMASSGAIAAGGYKAGQAVGGYIAEPLNPRRFKGVTPTNRGRASWARAKQVRGGRRMFGGGLLVAGGAVTFGAARGLETYHQHRINDRRRSNLQAARAQRRVKKNELVFKGPWTDSGRYAKPQYGNASHETQQPKGQSRNTFNSEQARNTAGEGERGYRSPGYKHGMKNADEAAHHWQQWSKERKIIAPMARFNRYAPAVVIGGAGAIGLTSGHVQRKNLRRRNERLRTQNRELKGQLAKGWDVNEPLTWIARKNPLSGRHKITIMGEGRGHKAPFGSEHDANGNPTGRKTRAKESMVRHGMLPAAVLAGSVPPAVMTHNESFKNENLKTRQRNLRRQLVQQQKGQAGVAKFAGTPEHGRRYRREEEVTKINFTPTPVLRQKQPITFQGSQQNLQAVPTGNPAQPGAQAPAQGGAPATAQSGLKPVPTASAMGGSPTQTKPSPKQKPQSAVTKRAGEFTVPVSGGRPRRFDPEDRRQRRLGMGIATAGLIGVASGHSGVKRLKNIARARQSSLREEIPMDRRALQRIGIGGAGIASADVMNRYANDPRNHRRH